MHIKDIMTVNPITVAPETTLSDAARIMLDQHVSALPVVIGGDVLRGIITDGDLLRRPELDTAPDIGWWRGFLAPETSASAFVKTRGRHVGEVMTAPVRSIAADAALGDAVALMAKLHIKQVPVVNGDRLVGLLARRNILAALVDRLLVVDDVVRSDDAITTAIRHAIATSKWAPKGTINIAVKDGVAMLSGSVFSEAERQALVVIAENSAGVRSVSEDLALIDPVSGYAYGSF
ncbi:MAG TPA: CBS domain-containing protein [Acidiphilium sp.]|nr:MAG: signal transduction protein [Acidiphilium sp. 21-60-14]OYV90747.1 MAG: signal transduction protein [Acidiphilium sp. 37-60-79]OZB40034.1 MAG: signal transduction protein [Acidiphilium sp. 34-60-192]HQT89568.1 CBS domain-containing protein [Acidiphilium sp.]HQU24859.1 CBS domain-containing protein [Acidiphilium sp.]